jgi:hypothetical protein
MKWNEILAWTLVVLFLSTLLTVKIEPTDNRLKIRETLSDAHYWEKYELNGMRTAWNDNLIIKFRKSVYDLNYNKFSVMYEPYYAHIVNDNTIYMRNTHFFNDTSFTMVEANLIGENDMIIYPIYKNTKLKNSYIYLKRKLPYQY